MAKPAAPRWLFKQEPASYPYSRLEADGQTVWEGVKNPLAKKHLRAVEVGDRVYFYHTGTERAIVGIMEVVARDPDDDTVLTVKAVGRVEPPVTLAQIKEEPELAAWDLVRLPRLSVLPVTPEQAARIQHEA